MSTVLVTGGSGTFGLAWVRKAIHIWDRVIVYSRDEVKHAAMAEVFGPDGPRLFLGDVRDPARLAMAMRGVDTVVHAAALKRVDQGAYSPSEMIATNVMGTLNVVNAAIHAGVQRVVTLSSDKCCAPINLYGATKLLAETYTVQANAYGFPSGTLLSAVRYGNILGSRGSVIGIWRDQVARGLPLTVTDLAMTRFVMTIEQAVALVQTALDTMLGGEVFIPLLPSADMVTLAHAVAPDANYPLWVTTLRPGGEKLAEALLNEEEPTRTVMRDGHFVVTPSHHAWTSVPWHGVKVDPGFVYRSDRNAWTLNEQELRALIASTEACS